MTVHRIRKADIKSGVGSYHERVLRRQFKDALQIKKVRMCRGCSKPKTECDCPKDMREAVRRYQELILAIAVHGERERREKQIARRRSKFKVVR